MRFWGWASSRQSVKNLIREMRICCQLVGNEVNKYSASAKNELQ